MDHAKVGDNSAASSSLAPSQSSSDKTGGRGPQRAKKVRSACERCRYRRIKCDGQTPACSNCAKSGSPCVDVDSRNEERRVSRSFVEDAVARIAWLEDIIQTQLPHINLSNGSYRAGGPASYPDASYWDSTQRLPGPHIPIPSTQATAGPQRLEQPSEQMTSSLRLSDHGLKRSLPNYHTPSHQESSLEQDTRSVALGLGFLSLNSDSRQLHYLGSSSGSLLASLVQTRRQHTDATERPRAITTPPGIDNTVDSGHQHFANQNPVQFDVLKASINDLFAQLRRDLPPRGDCDTLCEQFFTKLHPNHPFIHRPTFNWMVDALYACAATSPPLLLQHNGWPRSVETFDCNGEEHIMNGRKMIAIPVHVAAFQLLIVLSIGATLQIRRRLYHHNPEVFFNSAMSISKYVFNSISLPSLQATLLLLVHSLVGPSGNDIWTLTHLAMAHSIDIGIHREVGNKLQVSTVAVEMRRRLFFCVYSFDRSISTVQGRPFSISDGFYDVNLPSVDSGEVNTSDGDKSPDGPIDPDCISYSIHLFKMAQLVSRIKTVFYRLSQPVDGTPWSSDFVTTQSQLCEELEQWVSEVPSVVLFAPEQLKLRLSMKLRIHYHGTMCLLYQPSQAMVQPNDQALQICYHHAAERLQLYETLYESGNLVHSWRTVHDIFLAGTTVMYCVWISATVRDTISLPALAAVCRRCSSLLSVGGEWWPIIRKSKLSLERLASHTIEMFAEKSQTMESPSNTPTTLSSVPLELGQPVNAVGPSPGWPPAQIEETLVSVLNHDHDGQLSHIFESPAFPTGMLDLNESSEQVDDEFWTNLGEYVP